MPDKISGLVWQFYLQAIDLQPEDAHHPAPSTIFLETRV
ncbi:hypothetical protein V462_07810 [Pantoea ananatis 15320]|nr:hypothetical protein L585_11320 [Pantoea ananatis BRT175]PKC38314.1 hypothetical protein V462_07810 [Pantoea ananatis 15320]